MEPITLIILVGAALFSAGLGFMLSKVLGARTIATLEASVDQMQANFEQAQNASEELREELKTKEEQCQELAQDRARMETDVRYLQESLQNERQQVQEISEKASSLQEQKHDAQMRADSAAKLLSEAKTRQVETLVNLDAEKDAVSDLRRGLDEEKEKLAEQGKIAKRFEVQSQQAHEQIEKQNEKLEGLEQKLEQQRSRYEILQQDHAELKTSLEEREASHQRELEGFEKQKEGLKKDFENLANKIFEEKGKTFTTTSQASIDHLLKPFREQIEGFQKRINEVHDASVKGNTSLNSEIKKVLDIGLKMSEDANNLTSALKGDSQQRGAWGEAQLRRTLEMSGLVEEAHYEVQSAFKDADGKHKQTDYLVKLPDGKHIIIDSKVSLVAYDRALAAESPEEQTLAMNEHVKAVRTHIDDLSSKDYTNLIGMRSPSFVLMFMPIEPAYIEALKSNKDLFEYGYKKGIVLVSHTTLIPILRTVSNLWMIERSNQEAREISDKAGDIYNQVCLVAENLHKLGNTLSTVSNHYNKTVTSLVGTRGLHGKVERFQKLSNKVSKSMPALEPAHMDFESDRLSLIVEPVSTSSELASQDNEITVDESKPATGDLLVDASFDDEAIQVVESDK